MTFDNSLYLNSSSTNDFFILIRNRTSLLQTELDYKFHSKRILFTNIFQFKPYLHSEYLVSKLSQICYQIKALRSVLHHFNLIVLFRSFAQSRLVNGSCVLNWHIHDTRSKNNVHIQRWDLGLAKKSLQEVYLLYNTIDTHGTPYINQQ